MLGDILLTISRQGSVGTYFMKGQQILEGVSIYKIKLLLKLEEEVKEYGFLPIKSIWNVFEKLLDLENSLQEETKMALSYIAGYICHKDKWIDDTFFIMRNKVVF